MRRFLYLLLFAVGCQAATWYVSPYGTNTNVGNGPAPNQAWKTITCALVTSNSFLSPGDTVYIAPGVYRETVTLTKSFSGEPLYVRGDPRNEQGFTDTSGARISPAIVRWTANTTSDKAIGSISPALASSSCTNYSWFDLWLDGGTSSSSYAARFSGGNVAAGYNQSFTRCAFTSKNLTISVEPSADCAGNVHITNCIVTDFVGTAIYVAPASAPSAELDLDIDIVDSLVCGYRCVNMVDKAGSYAFVGVAVKSTALLGSYRCFSYTCTAANSPAEKNAITGCTLVGYMGIETSTTSNIFDNTYNLYHCVVPRNGSGATAGAGEQTSYNALFEFGQSTLWFNRSRPFFMPTFDSPILGFRIDIPSGQGTDIFNRKRPSGSGFWPSIYNAVGPMEYHDIGTQALDFKDTGDYSIKLTGPGDHQVEVPVNATPTTLSIKVRWSNSYSGTSPQVKRLAQPDLIPGDTGETVTADGSSETWVTLTLSSFTPSRKGVVILQLISNDMSGAPAEVWFDSLSRNY